VRIEFTVSRSQEYFSALVRPDVRRVTRRGVLQAAAAFVAAPLLVLVSEGEGVGTALGILCVAAAAGLLLRLRRCVRATHVPPYGFTSPRTWVITDHGLDSSTDLTRLWWAWKGLRDVDVRSGAYVFRHKSGALFDVPRAPMTPSDEAELSAFLADAGLLPKGAIATRA